MLLLALLAGCGGSDAPSEPAPPVAAEAEGASHIHGLGVDPADGSLYIATHTGLFRAAEGESRGRRVGDRRQDTMGFTVAGPGDFLGSGHPDARDGLPPLLGLIRSTDGGRTWQPVSLLGEADFHVLRTAGSRIYGFDATQGRLMVSADGGRTWDERRPPGALFDLAIDPASADRIVVSSDQGLFASRDGGRRWRRLDPRLVGLLAWSRAGLVLVDGGGTVHRSADAGRTWKEIGDIGGRPAALSLDGEVLHAALHSNVVKASSDGGRTWRVRAQV